MNNDVEYRVNARGLSGAGARLMIDNARADHRERPLRVVVSSADAADDVRTYLHGLGADVRLDLVGREYHVRADFHE